VHFVENIGGKGVTKPHNHKLPLVLEFGEGLQYCIPVVTFAEK
jgi:hypothetical protein